jgi:hypothetical protein
MSDGFGLDKAARRAAQNELAEKEQRVPVTLNWALPGKRVAFDWRYFRVDRLSTEPEDGDDL